MREDATDAKPASDTTILRLADACAMAVSRRGSGLPVDPPERALRILVVEDETLIAMGIRESVERLGHRVCGMAETEAAAVALAAVERPDIALMDVRLAGPVDGIEAARRLNALYGIRSIFLSGYADHATMSRLTATYPLGVVHKPFSTTQLRSALDLAARRLRTAQR